MKQLTVLRPSGFKTSGDVRVYDLEGRPFYFFNSSGPVHFNLPKGKYRIENSLTPAAFRRYKLPNLPKYERNLPLPKKFVIKYGDNPNTCSVFLKEGFILADNSLKELPTPARTFIYFHELGHYFYTSEEKCDLFAAREMLKRGFNPSHVAESPRITLRSSPDRVANCLNYAKRS